MTGPITPKDRVRRAQFTRIIPKALTSEQRVAYVRGLQPSDNRLAAAVEKLLGFRRISPLSSFGAFPPGKPISTEYATLRLFGDDFWRRSATDFTAFGAALFIHPAVAAAVLIAGALRDLNASRTERALWGDQALKQGRAEEGIQVGIAILTALLGPAPLLGKLLAPFAQLVAQTGKKVPPHQVGALLLRESAAPSLLESLPELQRAQVDSILGDLNLGGPSPDPARKQVLTEWKIRYFAEALSRLDLALDQDLALGFDHPEKFAWSFAYLLFGEAAVKAAELEFPTGLDPGSDGRVVDRDEFG